MTRKECLDKAAGCVLQDRNSAYGGPEDSFGVIANFWSVYLGRKVYPHDVAMMMALLKIARIKGNHGYADGYIDLAGYAACGAECVQTPAPEQKPDELMVLWKHKPKAEGVEEPKFKAGDKVQVRVTLPSVSDRIWVDGTYARHDRGSAFPHAVYNDAGLEENVKDEDIRPAPKAEGVEELVVSPFDAPQTKEELYSKILESNPATFKAHKPTGEELAEMAEEEAHG